MNGCRGLEFCLFALCTWHHWLYACHGESQILERPTTSDSPAMSSTQYALVSSWPGVEGARQPPPGTVVPGGGGGGAGQRGVGVCWGTSGPPPPPHQPVGSPRHMSPEGGAPKNPWPACALAPHQCAFETLKMKQGPRKMDQERRPPFPDPPAHAAGLGSSTERPPPPLPRCCRWC